MTVLPESTELELKLKSSNFRFFRMLTLLGLLSVTIVRYATPDKPVIDAHPILMHIFFGADPKSSIILRPYADFEKQNISVLREGSLDVINGSETAFTLRYILESGSDNVASLEPERANKSRHTIIFRDDRHIGLTLQQGDFESFEVG